jgi:murein L,D-transpeptidase YcbB/YkuD
MSGFSGLNDAIAMLLRILPFTQEIVDLFHKISDLLQRMGLMSATASRAVNVHASHTFDVKWVQSQLNKSLGTSLAIDGVMGPRTVEAVKQFQAMKGLQPDGWVGVLTLEKLEHA